MGCLFTGLSTSCRKGSMIAWCVHAALHVEEVNRIANMLLSSLFWRGHSIYYTILCRPLSCCCPEFLWNFGSCTTASCVSTISYLISIPRENLLTVLFSVTDSQIKSEDCKIQKSHSDGNMLKLWFATQCHMNMMNVLIAQVMPIQNCIFPRQMDINTANVNGANADFFS